MISTPTDPDLTPTPIYQATSDQLATEAAPLYRETAAALSGTYQHPDDRGDGSTVRRAPRHRLADADR